MASKRWVWHRPFKLPNSGTSGTFTVDIPRAAESVAVMNSSGAQIALSQGTTYTQPADALLTEPYVYMGYPISETQKMTVHWNSTGNLAAGNDSGVLIFSNEPIVVSGGPVKTGGVASNVTVQGTPTVNINTMPDVAVSSLPQVVVQTLPALAAGAAHIGEVAVNVMPVVHTITDSQANPPNLDATLSSLVTAVNAVAAAVNAQKAAILQAATNGIVATSQIAVTTTAVAVFNGVVTGRQICIRNNDAVNKLYIGATSGVTAATGWLIPPGASFALDVVSGSTIVIWGIGSASLAASIATIN